MSDLNSRVTDAIMKAEHLTRDTLLAWHEVAALEDEIARTDDDKQLSEIAQRGVWTARLTIRVLQALDRYSEPCCAQSAHGAHCDCRPCGRCASEGKLEGRHS